MKMCNGSKGMRNAGGIIHGNVSIYLERTMKSNHKSLNSVCKKTDMLRLERNFGKEGTRTTLWVKRGVKSLQCKAPHHKCKLWF